MLEENSIEHDARDPKATALYSFKKIQKHKRLLVKKQLDEQIQGLYDEVAHELNLIMWKEGFDISEETRDLAWQICNEDPTQSTYNRPHMIEDNLYTLAE